MYLECPFGFICICHHGPLPVSGLPSTLVNVSVPKPVSFPACAPDCGQADRRGNEFSSLWADGEGHMIMLTLKHGQTARDLELIPITRAHWASRPYQVFHVKCWGSLSYLYEEQDLTLEPTLPPFFSLKTGSKSLCGEDDLELLILLSPPFKCWGYRCGLSCLVYHCWGLNSGPREC